MIVDAPATCDPRPVKLTKPSTDGRDVSVRSGRLSELSEAEGTGGRLNACRCRRARETDERIGEREVAFSTVLTQPLPGARARGIN